MIKTQAIADRILAGASCRLKQVGTLSFTVLLLAGVMFASTQPTRAQLGPGDLQMAHALTANSAGWAALRSAVRMVLEQTEFSSQAPVDETADTLAVFLALEDGDGTLGAVLAGSVRAALLASSSRDPAIMAPYTELGLTRARASAIACLIYGSSPDQNAVFADVVGLDAGSRDTCPKTYQSFRGYWQEPAAPLRAQPKGAGAPAQVILDSGGGASASARAVLIAGQTLDAVGIFVTEQLSSAVPMTILASGCGRNGVPADVPPGTVVVCYELVGRIAASVERGIIASR